MGMLCRVMIVFLYFCFWSVGGFILFINSYIVMEHLSIDDVVATTSDQMLLERMISEKEGVVVVDLFYNSGTLLPIVR